MKIIRQVLRISPSRTTMEGAGVRLKRAFADPDPSLDPFLLLDDFHSENPRDYRSGFPWHPHRGIETITYMLQGEIRHGDSMGNKGVVGPGDVQWMTAGSGIVHEEMPHQRDGLLWGFQLWANLPATNKMMAPRYQDVSASSIPIVNLDVAQVKIICGSMNEVQGAVRDIVTDPICFDVTVKQNSIFTHDIPATYNAFAYVIEGSAIFGNLQKEVVEKENLVVFSEGDVVQIAAEEKGVRFLLCAGKPIGEPVAWRGPIVMNTELELQIAFEEFYNGTFIKHSS